MRKVEFFISSTVGAFFTKHVSPLHTGIIITTKPNPIIKLKRTANFSVFSISYILLLLTEC